MDSFRRAVTRGAQLDAPPPSLAGTDVDGSLKTDLEGNLILDSALRQLFDYFLATSGEETLEDISARIAYHIKQNLNLTNAQQAWQVFERYLQYKQQLDDVQEHDGSFEGMSESLKQQQALRISILGPELATAFYQEEDEFNDFSLARVKIINNPNLDSEQKQQMIEDLLASIPESSREAIQPQTNPLTIEETVIKQQEEGASDSEIWQIREQKLGADAADRLAILDRQRQHWAQQYSEYRNLYRNIEQSGMSGTDLNQAIENLRLQYFSEHELKRVQMLDKQQDGS